jgi:hypothetical protein
MRARTLVLALTLAGAPLAAPAGAGAAPERDVAPLVVTVDTGPSQTTLSTTTVTPGPVILDLVGRGGVDVVTFRHGYTVADLAKDAKKLFAGSVKVVRRVDRGVVFWGGTQATGDGAQIAMDLPAGDYTVLNIDKGTLATLTVAGTPEARSLPASGGTIRYVHAMDYRLPATLPHRGWITVTNDSSEPHFTDLEKVKKGTTAAQIGAYLDHGAHGQPPFASGEQHGNLPLSPGHSFSWWVDASRGSYAALCFWPSKKTGMPHALMGMYALTRLR